MGILTFIQILVAYYFENGYCSSAMDMGAVASLRNVKSAISVAKHVLQNTKHSLLVGSSATDFAVQMGFEHESLSTNYSTNLWKTWQTDHCQPNFWKVFSPYYLLFTFTNCNNIFRT